MISEYRPTERAWGGSSRAEPRGLYAFGGCDLSPLLGCRDAIREAYAGPFAIRHERLFSGSRTDLILQSLRHIPWEHAAPFLDRMGAPLDYFRARVFEPVFRAGSGRLFPKTAVALSLAADVWRPLYRHRRHGFLADPGAWWFGHDVEEVLAEPATARWFWRNFEPVGRLGARRSLENVRTIARLLKRGGAQAVLVVAAPRIEGHPLEPRRLAFNRAAAEAAEREGFDFVDVDALRGGPGTPARLLARRVFETLKRRGVLSASSERG